MSLWFKRHSGAGWSGRPSLLRLTSLTSLTLLTFLRYLTSLTPLLPLTTLRSLTFLVRLLYLPCGHHGIGGHQKCRLTDVGFHPPV